MSLPDIVRFTFTAGAGGPIGAVGVARWTLTSTTTYNGFFVGGIAFVPTLSKSGSTWTLSVTDAEGDNYTGTCAATADGGFSLTVGDWTKTGGSGVLATITVVADVAVSVAAQLATDQSTVAAAAASIKSGTSLLGTTGTYVAPSHPVSASYSLTYTLS
jgi:hypothetical protein